MRDSAQAVVRVRCRQLGSQGSGHCAGLLSFPFWHGPPTAQTALIFLIRTEGGGGGGGWLKSTHPSSDPPTQHSRAENLGRGGTEHGRAGNYVRGGGVPQGVTGDTQGGTLKTPGPCIPGRIG